MTITVHTALVLIALVAFALATIGVGAGRLNLIALGLLCWLASTIW